MAMASAVLLASENEKLCMENQCQKKKRAKKRTYIARGGILSGSEGASCAQATQIRQEVAIVEAVAEQPRRVVRKCSMCKLIEYTARTCPRR